MRGGRTGWYSPLLAVALLALLLAGCNLELKVAEPSLEVQIAAPYNPPNPVPFQYRFFADEPVLRCRYALSWKGEVLLAGETEPEAAGVWHDRSLQVPELAEGPYQLDLVIQAERSREFVDLAFLKKSVNFYVDHGQPEMPDVTLPNNLRYTEPQSVGFTHPEWPVPLGSPVKVYYTIDGTDPASSATRVLYSGSPAPLPFDSVVVTLKAIAEDEARNKSDPIAIPYYFAHIASTNPTGAKNDGNKQINIYGFGFVGVTLSDIQLIDADLNPRTLFFNTISEPYIWIAADLNGAPAGTATIYVTVNDRGPVTVSIPFQVTN